METSPVVSVPQIFVIDNRVRVYADGKNQSAYFEYGSYLIAAEEAKKLQKETYPNATLHLNPPKDSEKCNSHYSFIQQDRKEKEAIIKAKAKKDKKADKMKAALDKKIAELAELESI